MDDAIGIYAFFLGSALLLTVPIAVLLGLPLLGWNLRQFLRLKEKEIELRRMQSAQRLTLEARGLIPPYVDLGDPEAVLTWAKVASEVRAH